MSTLHAREIFNNARLMLIVIERADFRQHKSNNGYQLYGSIEPIAVIVCTRDGIYAVNMEAEPVAVDPMKKKIPELNTLLNLDQSCHFPQTLRR